MYFVLLHLWQEREETASPLKTANNEVEECDKIGKGIFLNLIMSMLKDCIEIVVSHFFVGELKGPISTTYGHLITFGGLMTYHGL